jgi:hypothetical protein
MAVADIIAGIRAQGQAAADAAVASVCEDIAARTLADLPGVAATTTDGAVVLTAPGLRARAFGTRRRAADPRFAGLVATLSRGRGMP